MFNDEESLFEAWCIMAESEGDSKAWVYYKYKVSKELAESLKKRLASIGVRVF